MYSPSDARFPTIQSPSLQTHSRFNALTHVHAAATAQSSYMNKRKTGNIVQTDSHVRGTIKGTIPSPPTTNPSRRTSPRMSTRAGYLTLVLNALGSTMTRTPKRRWFGAMDSDDCSVNARNKMYLSVITNAAGSSKKTPVYSSPNV